MRFLSKSEILAFRQCPKRLWLEVHHPEGKDDSKLAVPFQIGRPVGEVARAIYDPAGRGVLIDAKAEGYDEAFSRSSALLANGEQPVFKAGIKAGRGLAFADVMLPDRSESRLRWRIIEVKSTAAVEDFQRDDLAVQVHITKCAGISLASAVIAHVNTDFVYHGKGDYQGFLNEVDLTKDAFSRSNEVAEWIEEAQSIVLRAEEPRIETGPHCSNPYECGFCSYCNRGKVIQEFPISSLPNLHPARRTRIEVAGYKDLRKVPDELLSPLQQRVKEHSNTGYPYFDRVGAATELASYDWPALFLDFETVSSAVPIWEGSRPFQQIPFQFSLHLMQQNGVLDHADYLDLSGDDPSGRLTWNLVDRCGDYGPIFVFNAAFERKVIRELAVQFPEIGFKLDAIAERIVDLLPIVRRHFYHPAQRGSWSLKAILPVISPSLGYDQLDGIRNGEMAQLAFWEAISAFTSPERRREIESQLRAYCKLDTEALVRLWHFLGG